MPPNFQYLFEASPERQVVLNPSLVVVAVTAAYLLATHTTRDALLGRMLFEAFPVNPDDPDSVQVQVRLRASLTRVFETGVADTMPPEKFDIRRPASEGGGYEERWWSQLNVPLMATDGRVTHCLHRVDDITDRIRSAQRQSELEAQTQRLLTEQVERQRAFDEGERRMRFVLENMAEGLVIFDQSGTITEQNPASVRIHARHLDDEGRRLDQLVARWNVRAYPSGEDVPVTQWAIPRILRGEYVQMERFFVDCLDDPARSFVGIYNGQPVYDESGAFTYGFLTLEDITEQAQAESALRDANDQLQDADRRKDEFLGMLSHELRNPLAPIRNALFILDNAAPAGEAAIRAKQIANRQLAHLARLVDDLLDVTRIARGKIELRRESVDLATLVRRIADDHREMFAAGGITLSLDVPTHAVCLDADPTRLVQIVGNLLSNATKFTPAGGTVWLTLRNERTRARIEVGDTGAGVAPELLRSIFDPFVQARQSLARSEGGLGLGLAMVKALAELHGGEAHVSSAGAGHGAVFTVTLPIAAIDETVPGDDAAAPDRRENAGRRVVIVDDNVDAAETLAQLVRLFGHTAEVAHDGPDAVRAVLASRPDVVLCDIGLPGFDGYEVARQVRAVLADAVQLVAVTGYAQPDDIRRSVAAGFERHLAKPPDPLVLRQILG